MSAVQLSVGEGVAHIVFTRPEALNAINVATAEGLLAACEEVQLRADVRVVVLSGAGRAFMAGGDLAAFDIADDAPAVASAIIEPLHQALNILADMPQIVLGSVHGAVSGAGMSLALGCDMTLAADNTRFCLAYSAIATTIDAGGSWHLVRQVGLQRAMDLALNNRVLSAEEAYQLGIIIRVVSATELEAETHALAARLASGPAYAHRRMKGLLRQAGGRSLAEQLNAEHQAFRDCAFTDDFREGVSAFFAKRQAVFSNR